MLDPQNKKDELQKVAQRSEPYSSQQQNIIDQYWKRQNHKKKEIIPSHGWCHKIESKNKNEFSWNLLYLPWVSSERTTKGCKGCTCPYMACHATHTVTGGPPLNLFRIKISDNENDDATAADTTAADDEDDDCDNDYTHSINNYWQRKHWTLTVLQEVGQSWHVIWIRKTTSTDAKSCSRLRRWGNKILLFKIKLLISQKTMTLRLVLLTSFFNLAMSMSVLLFYNWQLYVYVSSVCTCISIYHIKLYVIDSYNSMQRRSCPIA